MNQRYYFLRGNRETGPLVLDELLQQCLLPGDRLWVEGQSLFWQRPDELPELQIRLLRGYTHRPICEAESQSSVASLEQRAEALRRRALATLCRQQKPNFQNASSSTAPATISTHHIELVHHRPQSPGIVSELLLLGTLAALGLVGWRSGFFARLIQVRPQIVSVATPLEVRAQQVAPAPDLSVASATTDSILLGSRPPAQDTVIPLAHVFVDAKLLSGKDAPSKKVKDGSRTLQANASTSVLEAPIIAPDTSVSTVVFAAEKTQPVATAVPQHGLDTVSKKEEGAGRKGLSQVLRGLFRKRKKPDESASPDAN